MDIGSSPSDAILRDRMDSRAEAFRPIVERSIRDCLVNRPPALSGLDTGHIPVDADVTPMDNRGSRHEGASRTTRMAMPPWRYNWDEQVHAWCLECVKASRTARRTRRSIEAKPARYAHDH
jgi:hypothetical protein